MSHKTAVFLTCASLLVLTGCSRAGSSKPQIAFITNNAADFWTIARKGADKAAAEMPDVTVEFRLGDGTAAEQKRIVDDLLAKGITGIAISPVDPANQTAMLDDVAQKAVVFTHDSDAPNSKRECYVGTDNVAAGRQAGALIKEALPQGGKIALFVGKLDARNAQERLQGIKEAIAGTKIEILDIRTDDTDQVRAKANVAEMLVSHPDVAGARRAVELQRAGDSQRREGRRQDRPGEDHHVRRRRRDAHRRQVRRHRRHGRAAAVRVRVSGDDADWRRSSRGTGPASRRRIRSSSPRG